MNASVAEDRRFLNRVTDATIRIALLAGLVAWCVRIVMPFLIPVVWGVVFAIGAIGGMMASGILGLFVGSVVLAVGYELFLAWITARAAPQAEAGESDARDHTNPA